MAHIQPFRGWRYRPDLTPHLGELISPPFDTVSAKQRAALYRQPYNSIHLSVPDSNAEAARTLYDWKTRGILRRDSAPSVYVYYQYFHLPGEARAYCRKGFVCFIEVTPWSERVVLRHEDIMPHSVQDRVDLLAATQLNASPTHGLYTDPAHQLEPLMDASMQELVYQVEDYQGVRDTMSIIDDPAVVARFIEVLRNKPIILADGHHRYESSLIYRRQCERVSEKTGAGRGCRYHMMYLTNTEAPDLRILPTHRLIRRLPDLDYATVLRRTQRYFHLQSVENAGDIPEVIAGKPRTFGLLLGDESYRIHPKAEVLAELDGELAAEVREVDTAVLHYVFISKVLGIPPAAQRDSPNIIYERSFAQCLYRVAKEEVALALITHEVSIAQIKRICYGGYRMPPKSTYFYPKAIGGFVFGSIRDDEL